jgi:hypothetical protein
MQIYGWTKIDGIKHLVTYGGGPEGGYVSVGGLVCSWHPHVVPGGDVRAWWRCCLVFRKPNEDYCNWYVKEVPIGGGYQLKDDEITDIEAVIEAIDQETLRQEAVDGSTAGSWRPWSQRSRSPSPPVPAPPEPGGWAAAVEPAPGDAGRAGPAGDRDGRAAQQGEGDHRHHHEHHGGDVHACSS